MPDFHTHCTLADIPVLFHHKYAYLSDVCHDFITQTQSVNCLNLTVTPDDINLERSRTQGYFPEDVLESTAALRLFCQAAATRHIVLLHACVVEADGLAYAFVAPSGTGKTTHARMWLQYLGRDRARILNGDKPFIRVSTCVNSVDTLGFATAYGSPWNGKEQWGAAASAPLAGVCILRRGGENHISPLPFPLALAELTAAVYRTETHDGAQAVMDSVLSLAQNIPIYEMFCTASEEAAVMAWTVMRKDTAHSAAQSVAQSVAQSATQSAAQNMPHDALLKVPPIHA